MEPPEHNTDENQPDSEHGAALLRQLRQVNPQRAKELEDFFKALQQSRREDQLSGQPGKRQFINRPSWLPEIPDSDLADMMKFWL